MPVLVFFGVAAIIGCALWGAVRMRLRAAARRPGATDDDLCQLRQADRISSVAVAASVAGLAAVGLVLVLV